MLRERGPGSARFLKVLGHATAEDVRRGRSTQMDKLGNDGADDLAVSGAMLHAAPGQLVEASRRRKAMARATHTMMLAIVARRRQREEELGWGQAADDADRGSCADAAELAGLLQEIDEMDAAGAAAGVADEAADVTCLSMNLPSEMEPG